MGRRGYRRISEAWLTPVPWSGSAYGWMALGGGWPAGGWHWAAAGGLRVDGTGP
jgi:hypothetical protein